MRLLTASSLQDLDRAVADFAHEDRDRHAPGALARDHPVGAALDHAGDAVLALRRDPARLLDRRECAMRAACRACPRDGAANGLSIAMNHCGVLRKITGFFERHECGYWCFRRPRAISMPLSVSALITAVIGVALLALVGEHALAGKARRMVGERAVLVDRVGDGAC